MYALDFSDDDVIPIGKLRRPARPCAAVSYDPGYGIRIEGEDAPPEPASAATWIRNYHGWLRISSTARRSKSGPVQEFLKAFLKFKGKR